MVWKLLSGISAACLAVAAYYAFISKNDINMEREGEKRATANLAEVSTRKAVADEKLKQKQEQLVALNLDLERPPTWLELNLGRIANSVLAVGLVVTVLGFLR